MVMLTFVVLYAVCSTVLLLAVAQDRRRSGQRRAEPRQNGRASGQQHDLVLTTHH